MRWLVGVVVMSAVVARAEEEPVHRQPPVALRMSALAGGGFILPESTCADCGASFSNASFSGALELAVVLRSRAGEGYFADQLVWYPVFSTAPQYALTPGPDRQMLALTAEVGFLGRVSERILFGGGALVALSFIDPMNAPRRTLTAFGNVLMPGLSMRLAVVLDKLEVHRVGINLSVLARLNAPGIIMLPTLSYSATLPW